MGLGDISVQPTNKMWRSLTKRSKTEGGKKKGRSVMLKWNSNPCWFTFCFYRIWPLSVCSVTVKHSFCVWALECLSLCPCRRPDCCILHENTSPRALLLAKCFWSRNTNFETVIIFTFPSVLFLYSENKLSFKGCHIDALEEQKKMIFRDIPRCSVGARMRI